MKAASKRRSCGDPEDSLLLYLPVTGCNRLTLTRSLSSSLTFRICTIVSPIATRWIRATGVLQRIRNRMVYFRRRSQADMVRVKKASDCCRMHSPDLVLYVDYQPFLPRLSVLVLCCNHAKLTFDTLQRWSAQISEKETVMKRRIPNGLG